MAQSVVRPEAVMDRRRYRSALRRLRVVGSGVAWAGVLASVPALAAQTAVGDSARPVTAAGPDGRAPTAGVPDSAGSARTGGDSVAAPSRPPTLPVPTSLPPDSTMRRACAGLGAGALAPNLLVVVFRAGTLHDDRVAAAKAVGGSLGMPTRAGEEYVYLSDDAGRLEGTADRLIRQDPVTRVSPVSCPPLSPSAPGPPAARP